MSCLPSFSPYDLSLPLLQVLFSENAGVGVETHLGTFHSVCLLWCAAFVLSIAMSNEWSSIMIKQGTEHIKEENLCLERQVCDCYWSNKCNKRNTCTHLFSFSLLTTIVNKKFLHQSLKIKSALIYEAFSAFFTLCHCVYFWIILSNLPQQVQCSWHFKKLRQQPLNEVLPDYFHFDTNIGSRVLQVYATWIVYKAWNCFLNCSMLEFEAQKTFEWNTTRTISGSHYTPF